MCLDPVSLGAGVLGAGASVLGGQMNADAANQQAQAIAIDNTNAARASNKVLNKFENVQVGNQASNTAALQPVYGAIDPTTFGAAQDATAAKSSSDAAKAIAATLASAPTPTLTNTDNGQSAKAIADRSALRTGVSVSDAAHQGVLNAFGTNFSDLGLKEADTNRNLDTTNAAARAQAAALPQQEQTAAFKARTYIAPADTTGSTIQGLGSVFAGLGGSGLASKGVSSLGSIGNWWNSPSISNPSLPTPNFQLATPTNYATGY